MDRLHLIAEIFNRPALWDLQSEEYKIRGCIPVRWKEVAASMGPDVTVDECKRKWKNLRDAYRAEIKRIELRIERDLLSGKYDPKNDYSSKWAYFEHLKFIKDIRRPRRRRINTKLYLYTSDNYDDDNDLEFSDHHNIDSADIDNEDIDNADMDNAELETDIKLNTESFSLDKDDDNDSQIYSEKLWNVDEKQQQTEIEDSAQPTSTININNLAQNSSRFERDANNKITSTLCRCSKRSYEHEDVEKEEQHVRKSMRLDIIRSNDLSHIGDSDYNFLVSFLPQIKKMNELQNLKFRAKMSDFIFSIMSQSISDNV